MYFWFVIAFVVGCKVTTTYKETKYVRTCNITLAYLSCCYMVISYSNIYTYHSLLHEDRWALLSVKLESGNPSANKIRIVTETTHVCLSVRGTVAITQNSTSADVTLPSFCAACAIDSCIWVTLHCSSMGCCGGYTHAQSRGYTHAQSTMCHNI